MGKVKDNFMDEIERNHREADELGLTEPKEQTMVATNPTRLQLFLRKKIWFNLKTHSIGISLAQGLCILDLRKPH